MAAQPKHVIEIFDLSPAQNDKKIGYKVTFSDELTGTDADYLALSLKNTLAIIGQEMTTESGHYPWPL